MDMIDDTVLAAAETVLQDARAAKMTLATVESCTGGLIMAALTAIAGSSDVVDRGFVTYSNAAKAALVGVREQSLALHGAVSETVAREMAAGGLARSDADLCLSVTGIAGPSGGSDEKPVGLVWIGLAKRGGAVSAQKQLYGDVGRSEVRRQTVLTALQLFSTTIKSRTPEP